MIWVSSAKTQDAFEKHCMGCHAKLPASLERIFFNYLLVYSSQKDTQEAIIYYLKSPDKDISLMSDLFLDTFGVKKATKLDDKTLKEAVDIYWKRYNVIDKIR
ncbi:MAG: hypothetical protein KU38_10665 [Sulfurovum sp. FS08-3]|nr:MAG: hypothetical protein KU38_10665 [Sulfurovum sp. FS08-3]